MKKIFFLFFFLIVGCSSVTNSDIVVTDTFEECKVDEDCSFFWRGYYDGNPCGACDYENEKFDCMNADEANSELAKLKRDLFGGSMPSCEPCLESDFESLVCKCVGNRCAKIAKT